MTPEPKNPGLTADARFPTAAPHRPSALHVRRASVRVDAADRVGPLPPICASLGCDEINWTYTATGKRLLRAIEDIEPSGGDVELRLDLPLGSASLLLIGGAR